MTTVLIIANILGLLAGLFIYKNKHSSWYKFFLTMLVFYIIIISSTYLYDVFLHYKLNSFDLNGDGVFSNAESTIAQQQTMNLVINDAGRKMIYITGMINAFLSTLIIYIIYFIFSSIKSVVSHHHKS